MNDIKIISILLSGLLLAGCNGSDDKDIISRPQTPPTASNINPYLHNITRAVLIDKSTTIALAKRDNERISDIELIAEDNEFDCYNYNINDSELVINPVKAGNCIYQYQTESFDGFSGRQGVLHLAKSASLSAINTTGSLNPLNFDAPRLPIYSYAVQVQDSPLFIGINQLHADKVNQGFIISTAALSGPSGAMFEFFETGFRFATDQATPLGAYRIYYGLTNGVETYLGQIDIAVGNKTNMGFSVQSYRYPTPLEIDQAATISLSQLSNVIDNPEGDALEIVQVSTINASASTDGTSLTFSAPSRGDYSLSYLLTDNLGAFVMGQVMFYVKGPFEDIKTPLGTLMAPITLEDALEIGFDYSSPNVDTQKSAEIATFTYDVAEAICTLYGAKLPSKSIIDSLYELSVYKWSAINDIKTRWPIDKPYILQGIQTDEQGTQVYTGQSFKTDILNTLYVGDNEIVPESSYLSCLKEACEHLGGPCIDIFDIGSGKLFTSSPSAAFVESFGGIATNNFNNEGRIGVFYLFNWHNANALCDTYNTYSLGGRTNWGLATHPELQNELYGLYGNMFTARGWPIGSDYWSATPLGSGYLSVNLDNGSVGSSFFSSAYYASCVSSP
ncbi:hypothetical protein GCS56_003414 [Vibrio metschnikovii]|nr:hypothetical protein [Vibrio metschnikovii]